MVANQRNVCRIQYAVSPISITLYYNHLKWNPPKSSSKFFFGLLFPLFSFGRPSGDPEGTAGVDTASGLPCPSFGLGFCVGVEMVGGSGGPYWSGLFEEPLDPFWTFMVFLLWLLPTVILIGSIFFNFWSATFGLSALLIRSNWDFF